MTRILLVDDEPALLDVEKQILEKKFGFVIETSASGEDALRRIQSESFDAVISDYAMPGMNGLTLLHRIREIDRDIPFVLFTIRERDEIAVEALNSGANFYVQKEKTPNIAFTELAHKVTTAVELVRAQKNLQVQRDLAINCAESGSAAETIRFCLEAAKRVSNLQAIAVYLIDEHQHLSLERVDGFSEAYTQHTIQAHLIPLFHSLLRGTDNLFRDHQTILLYSRILSSEENIRSDAIITLSHHGRTIGVLHLASHEDEAGLPAPYKRSLQGISIQIAGHISDRMAEDALKESERTLKTLFGNLPGMVYKCTLDEERTMELVSEGSVALTGYTPGELVGDQNPTYHSLIHPEDRPLLMEVIHRAVAKHVQFKLTYRIFTRSMKFRWVWEQGAGIYDSDGQVSGLEGFIIDITRQKMLDDQVRMSQNRLTMLFSTMKSGCAIFHEVEEENQFTLIEMNEASEMIEGRSKEEMVGKPFEEVFSQAGSDELSSAFHQIAGDGLARTLPRVPFDTPGGRQWREFSLTRTPRSHGREIFVIYHDVTDQVQDEEQIIASLHEKELLLKEVHHRVKNNLQIISGILKLQSMRSSDPTTSEILLDCRNQVFSMAHIHEMLYNSRDFSRIQVAEYVENLVDHLKQEYQGTGARITFITDIDPDIILDIDRCITCGLILNELITNAVKYAFEPGADGEIRVTFRHLDQTYSMEVADNGRGIPVTDTQERGSSLGTELVKRLTHQIRGLLTMDGSDGTRITIRFNEKPGVRIAP